jgi:DNA-binding NtrC family response regulator
LREDAASPKKTAIAVLLVGPCDSRRRTLRNIFKTPDWQLREACTYREALGILDHRHIGVVICYTELQDGNWQTLLADLQNRTDPPNLIVSSRLADERLWAEVLNLGGYDVLVQPFDRAEVLRVARMACIAWQLRCQTLAVPSPGTFSLATAS